MRIYTIGHSTKSEFELARKLKKYHIDVLVDVRSVPFSSYNPQFNRFHLASFLEKQGFQYIWKGKNLGGKYGKEGNESYDENVDWLLKIAENDNVCIMCSEGNYKQCHRHQMIEPDLFEKADDDFDIYHIGWSKDHHYGRAMVKGVQTQQKLFKF